MSTVPPLYWIAHPHCAYTKPAFHVLRSLVLPVSSHPALMGPPSLLPATLQDGGRLSVPVPTTGSTAEFKASAFTPVRVEAATTEKVRRYLCSHCAIAKGLGGGELSYSSRLHTRAPRAYRFFLVSHSFNHTHFCHTTAAPSPCSPPAHCYPLSGCKKPSKCYHRGVLQ